MKEKELIDLEANVKTNIYFHKKRPLCRNCGHSLVLVDGKPHHEYEFISWGEAPSKRKFRCDFYKADGKTSCCCDRPELDDKSKDDLLRERILQEMTISKESE